MMLGWPLDGGYRYSDEDRYGPLDILNPRSRLQGAKPREQWDEPKTRLLMSRAESERGEGDLGRSMDLLRLGGLDIPGTFDGLNPRPTSPEAKKREEGGHLGRRMRT